MDQDAGDLEPLSSEDVRRVPPGDAVVLSIHNEDGRLTMAAAWECRERLFERGEGGILHFSISGGGRDPVGRERSSREENEPHIAHRRAYRVLVCLGRLWRQGDGEPECRAILFAAEA